jgi:hypothetical protein
MCRVLAFFGDRALQYAERPLARMSVRAHA